MLVGSGKSLMRGGNRSHTDTLTLVLIMRIAYHGTSKENAKAILDDGFKLDTEHRRDPGDLGRGIYFYGSKWQAKILNQTILAAEIDDSHFLTLVPPRLQEVLGGLRKKYGCTIWGKAEHKQEGLHSYLDVRGHDLYSERTVAAWAWRNHFLGLGWLGLLVKGWDSPGVKHARFEVVVFDLTAIHRVWQVN